MKIPCWFCAFFLIPLAVFAQPATPDAFLAEIREAISKKDAAKLFAMTYTEGASEADKAMMTKTLPMIFGNDTIEKMDFEPLGKDFQAVRIMRGKKIEPTLPPSGTVHITYKPTANGMNSSNMAYSIVDGRYFLTGIKTTDLDWKGAPDKTIGFMVMGSGQEKVQIKAKWNASGVQQENAFDQPSVTMLGQYFESISVTSEEPDTNVTITVMEEGKKIFQSEALKGQGKLEYKKP